MIPTTGFDSQARSAASQPPVHAQDLVALLDAVRDAAIAADDHLIITYWNRAAEDLFGWTAAEAVGSHFHALLGAEQGNEELLHDLQETIPDGSISRRAALRRRDGQRVMVDATILRPVGADGQPRGYMITMRSINEQQRLLEQIEGLKASLNQQRSLLDGVLESTSDCISTVDLQCRYTAINHACRHYFSLIFGREIKEGDSAVEVLAGYPDVQRRMRELWGRALRGETFKVTEIFGDPENPVAQDLSFGPVYDPQGAVAGAAQIIMDVSGRVRAEEALLERSRSYNALSQEMDVERGKLAAVIDTMCVGVGIADVRGDTTLLNAAGLKLHGFQTEAEMLRAIEQYHELFELRRMDGSILPQEEWPAARASRGIYITGEEILVRNLQNGAEHIVSYSNSPVKNSQGETTLIVYVMQDLTERKRTEIALRESERHFRYLADALPQLVWTAQPDGRVDYYNQRYREYSGIAEKENGVWEWSPVLHADDVAPTIEAWTHAVQTGTIYQAEHRVQMPDGSYRWHLSRGFPVHDAQGNVVRWFGTATDIHDLKLADASLKEYAERLAQSNQDLQNFAFIASHDLQEPLRKITGFADMLKRSFGENLNEENSDILERMQSAANRMQEMIRGLLELSRVNTHGQSFVPVDLNQTAATVISDLEPLIQRTHGTVIVGWLPTISADPLQTHQLLQNLISNALKFHDHQRPPRVEISAEVRGKARGGSQQVVLRVQDNGVGFEEQYFERILEPFQRLHGRGEYEGTGMGLAIVRRIVERHHGKITARSNPGEGTVFEVTLPMNPGRTQ